MLHLIIELSKYIIIMLLVVYTYFGFSVLVTRQEERANRMYRIQLSCTFLIHLLSYLIIFAVKLEIKYLILYGLEVLFLIGQLMIYRILYKNSARLVVNHMCTLLMIGFVMLARLNWDGLVRQFEIAVAATVLSLFVPALIRKFKALRKFTWFYAIFGILALGVVLLLGKATGGANLSFTVAGITVQPSEFIKIIFVFFVACMFYHSIDFKQICITTVAAAIHVLILVASNDLGAALIFFVTYVVMLYVATRKPVYFFGGLLLGGAAGYVAGKTFSHVKTRIEAWKDPFANYDSGGYQVAQSLFAIGTGGWFGMGLFQGMPESIPVASSDFIFAAIVEELGGIFGLCLILICFSCFMMILNISMQIHDLFYKLIALGLGCSYAVQVVLNIGGVIKFIPSTGVTLPLVSYGGSSILCTIIMFAIIQGLYIARLDEGEADEPKTEPERERKKKSKFKIRQNRAADPLPKVHVEEPKKAGHSARRTENEEERKENGTAGARKPSEEYDEDLW